MTCRRLSAAVSRRVLARPDRSASSTPAFAFASPPPSLASGGPCAATSRARTTLQWAMSTRCMLCTSSTTRWTLSGAGAPATAAVSRRPGSQATGARLQARRRRLRRVIRAQLSTESASTYSGLAQTVLDFGSPACFADGHACEGNLGPDIGAFGSIPGDSSALMHASPCSPTSRP